ncbi:MAG: AzlD domain-containing protein, partial [Chloroflexia bacterium]|nr:AzlD domain-containing protein [Chloroflexia bacterium]
EEGIPGVCAVAVTAMAMRRTNNLLIAMVAGIGTVWLVRQIV